MIVFPVFIRGMVSLECLMVIILPVSFKGMVSLEYSVMIILLVFVEGRVNMGCSTNIVLPVIVKVFCQWHCLYVTARSVSECKVSVQGQRCTSQLEHRSCRIFFSWHAPF